MFCKERVGIRKTFLMEHFAAFSGSDVVSWFATRTNANEGFLLVVGGVSYFS